jgi:hypothetical protein
MFFRLQVCCSSIPNASAASGHRAAAASGSAAIAAGRCSSTNIGQLSSRRRQPPLCMWYQRLLHLLGAWPLQRHTRQCKEASPQRIRAQLNSICTGCAFAEGYSNMPSGACGEGSNIVLYNSDLGVYLGLDHCGTHHGSSGSAELQVPA